MLEAEGMPTCAGLRGISVQVHPRCEWLHMHVDPDGPSRYRALSTDRSDHDDHPRTIHLWSPRLERRVRVGRHVQRQLGRDEIPCSVDDPKSFEPCPRCCESAVANSLKRRCS